MMASASSTPPCPSMDLAKAAAASVKRCSSTDAKVELDDVHRHPFLIRHATHDARVPTRASQIDGDVRGSGDISPSAVTPARRTLSVGRRATRS